MGYSNEGGPQGIPGRVSISPTPPPTPDESLAIGASDASTSAMIDALDEPFLTDIDSGADQLLSTAVPDGLSNPYSSAEGGWTIGPQEVDPYANAIGQSGPLSPYAGQDVDPYAGLPADGANPNPYTGGQNVNPFEGSQNAASSAVDPTNTSQWSGSNEYAAGSNSDSSAVGQNFETLEDYLRDLKAAEKSQELASNDPNRPDPNVKWVPTIDGGFIAVPVSAPSVPITLTIPLIITSVTTISEVTTGNPPNSDQVLMQTI